MRTSPILVVEEAAERIEQLADRVFLLDAGEIVASGTTDEILGNAALLDIYLG